MSTREISRLITTCIAKILVIRIKRTYKIIHYFLQESDVAALRGVFT